MRARLLVATTDEDARAAFLGVLDSDWTIDHVGDGQAALTLATSARPDVLFVGAALPGLHDLIYAIRASLETRHIPVVLVGTPAELGAAQGRGIDDVLTLPAEPVEIVSRVRMLVELSHLRSAANHGTNTFLRLVGHELRNPLAALSTTLQAVAFRAPSRETELMQRSVGRLTKLVDDLLDISRLARGVVKLQTRVIELAQVVDRALELLAPQLASRTVSVSVPRTGLRVECDLGRLAQAIANVVLNATQHSAESTTISIEVEHRGTRLYLRIKDRGDGIAADKLESSFDSFRTPRIEGGLGLGLAIARGIIELHGGTIQLHSAGKGQGTECEIELSTTERSAHAESPVAAQGERKRLLLVEDDDDTARSLKLALEQLGYSVALAHDGPVALAIADAFEPDVALLDLGLPVMDGWELSKRLREKLADELPCVAVTAFDQEGDKQRSIDMGFADHLVKPIDVARLQKLVEGLPKSRS
jgi:signal transduction histidine kinase